MRPLLLRPFRGTAACRCQDQLYYRRVARKSSTAAAAVSVVTDSVEFDDQDDHVDLHSSVAAGRPRLQRLRERLQREKLANELSIEVSQWAKPRASAGHRHSSSPSLHESAPTMPLPNAVPPPLQPHPAPPAPAPSPPSYDELRDLLRDYPDPSPDRVLVDSFARRHTYLRLSLTERCNLRCTYCMPEQGVPLQPASHLLQTPELLHLAKTFAGLGVTKFRLTGGEPTLRSDVVAVVQGLRQLQPRQIGMTSNGIKIPSLLDDLVEAGLDSLNVSLDTLCPDRFAQLTRRPAKYLDRVWEALALAHERAANPNNKSHHNNFSVKLNCVVMRGINDHEVADFCRLAEQYPKLHVRFIEYMPFDENGWNQNLLVGYRELLDRLEAEGVVLEPVPSDDPHDTTKWYAWPHAAATSRIGFITSMSAHFCDSCNRIRLTADGQLKSCLFDGGEVSLARTLRDGWDDAELRKLVHWALQKKPKALGGHNSPDDINRDARRNRPMTLIGG